MAIKKRGIPENIEVCVTGCVRHNGQVYAPIEGLIKMLKEVPNIKGKDLAVILESRKAPSDLLPELQEQKPSVYLMLMNLARLFSGK